MSGGGLGSALGSTAATGLGFLLAPETMGASLAIPAGIGALGGALGGGAGSAASGGKNPWGSALSGGVLGGLGGLGTGLISGGQGFLSGLLGDSGGADLGAEQAIAQDSAPLSGISTGEAAADPVVQNASSGLTAQDLLNTPVSSATTGGDVAQSLGATANANANSPSWLTQAQQALGLGGTTAPSSAGNSVSLANGAGNVSGAATKSGLSGLSSYLAPAGLALGLAGALMPRGSNPTNIAGNASAVNATNPSFNAPLAKYNYNSTSTPYTGNWYTYGLRPETPMVQNTVTPAAKGGLMHFAQGGQVPAQYPNMPPLKNMSVQDIVNALPEGVTGRLPQQMTPSPNQGPPPARHMPMPSNGPSAPMYGGYARGGLARYAMGGAVPMAAPQSPMMAQQPPMIGIPPHGIPSQASPMQNPQQSPLAKAQQFAMGHKLGQALRGHIKNQMVFQGDGHVKGPGAGQDDSINARLSNDEFVLPADVVSHLGDGSSDVGGKRLTHMMHKVRAHKSTKGFPPKAKSPLSYIGAK